jgi:alpha-beta hydrolase superfamily lysophospholipase
MREPYGKGTGPGSADPLRRFSVRSYRAALILVVSFLAAPCAPSTQADSTPRAPTRGTDAAAIDPAATNRVPTTADPSVDPGIDDFYTVPAPLPTGEPGDIIRIERASNISITAATRVRVMYHSRNRNDDDIAVTGIIAIPNRRPAPTRGYPVVSWAHGTTGIGPTCAPSREVNGNQGLVQHTVDSGYVYAATDYSGLGPNGQRHPYLSGVTEAHNAIDIVRAAIRLSSTDASPEWVVYGHSQGGQAALFAAQLAPTYAPELHLLGAVATAPASPLALATATADRASRPFVIMMLLGLPTDYPQLRPEDYLTDKALAADSVVDAGCGAEIAARYWGFGPGETVKASVLDVEPARSILAENDPGQTASSAPIFIPHGTDDRLVPAWTSQVLFERLCRRGQVVDRKTYAGQNHGAVVLASTLDVDRWIADRFAARPAPNGCAAAR